MAPTLYSKAKTCPVSDIAKAPQAHPKGLGRAHGGEVRRRYAHASWSLTKRQVTKLYEVALQAWEAGNPLNRFITIHLKGTPAHDAPQAFTNALMMHTRKWLKRRGLSHAYVWVLENGPEKGVHLHLLQHVPAGHQVAYKRALGRWLPFAVSRPRIVIKPIGYPSHGGFHERSQLAGVLRYMCKGIAAPALGIIPVGQGKVTGRRCGMSKNVRADL